MKSAVIGSMNDVANTWHVDSIFNHREEFEKSILNECNKRTSQWFTISQLRTNMVPPDALKASIIKKTNSIQEIQVAESQKLVADADAQRKISVAKGDSAEGVIRASGRAETIRREQLNLTPMYIEYKRVEKWNGVTPTTVLGSNTSVMLPAK